MSEGSCWFYSLIFTRSLEPGQSQDWAQVLLALTLSCFLPLEVRYKLCKGNLSEISAHLFSLPHLLPLPSLTPIPLWKNLNSAETKYHVQEDRAWSCLCTRWAHSYYFNSPASISLFIKKNSNSSQSRREGQMSWYVWLFTMQIASAVWEVCLNLEDIKLGEHSFVEDKYCMIPHTPGIWSSAANRSWKSKQWFHRAGEKGMGCCSVGIELELCEMENVLEICATLCL